MIKSNINLTLDAHQEACKKCSQFAAEVYAGDYFLVPAKSDTYMPSMDKFLCFAFGD